MHVGVYIYDYVPTAGGGYTFQREILKTVIELAHQSKHRFSVMAHTSNELLKNKIDFGAVNFIPIDRSPDSSSRLGTLLRKFRAITNLSANADILSPLDFTVKRNGIEFVWFVTPAYELIDTPYIATVWDLQHRLQPWFPEVGRISEWNGREEYISTFLKRATYIIAANAIGQKEIGQFYQIPEDRIVCLTHPAPQLSPVSSREIEETLMKYGLKPGYLFYPAQYWAHKNHANLLFALRVLKEKHLLMPAVVFVGADKGNLDYLKRLSTDLDVASQVHFLGFVTDIEMTVLYKNALALVYLSFFGPENLPPLEAFSVGCPVIAAKVDGAVEQLGGAALLVNPIKPDEIALAIKSLIIDPQKRASTVADGFERIKQATPSGYVLKVFDLLDEFEPVRLAWGSDASGSI